MPTARFAAPVLVAALLAAGCAGGSQTREPAPAVVERPLAGMAAQRIVVTPVGGVSEVDPLGWSAAIPRQRAWLEALDSAITAELGARGLGSAWVFPAALVRSYERNRSLSPDPHRLASAPLRGITRLSGDFRIPEPLASQLRTLVAVHDARFTLLPLEVTFEKAAAGEAGGRARLRLAIVDARTTELRWIGDVRSDLSPVLTPAVTASLAGRLADLIVAR